MKSAAIASVLLASVAIAQPHAHHRRHHHEKRDIVVEWTTEYVTQTVWIDETGTSTVPLPTVSTSALPATSAVANAPGQFYEPAKSSSQAPAEQAQEVPTTTSTTAASTTAAASTTLVPTTSAAPVVVAPPVQSVAQVKSSVPAPAPAPVHSSVVAPAPVPVASSSSVAPAAPAASYSSGGGSSSAGDRTGDMTYYAVGLGACGWDNTGDDQTENIVAVSQTYFQSVSSLTSYGIDMPANPLCGKTITVSANGKSIQCTIRDACPGCTVNSIDVTEKAFKELFGSLDVGRGTVTWSLNN